MTQKFYTRNWRRDKIVDLPFAMMMAEVSRSVGKRLVTVNGTFDILHPGHLDQLEEARKQGDVLFVGINSDASVREGKGEGRPYFEAPARAALLAALECVSYVSIIDAAYDGGVPAALLEAIKPAVHVNGADYGAPETWREWPIMQKHKVRGHLVPHYNSMSTSILVEKIRNTHPEG